MGVAQRNVSGSQKAEKTTAKARSPTARTRRETENDEVPDGENLTAEQLDIASVETLQNYTDVGLRNFAEQCRHWRKMAQIELERRSQRNRAAQN